MELNSEKIINDQAESLKAKKYWLVFLIMAPIGILIGLMGGNILMGVVFDLVLAICCIVGTIKSKNIIKNLKAGNFELVRDTVVSKSSYKRTRKSGRTYFIQSAVLFKTRHEVLHSIYDALDEGDTFVALMVKGKYVTAYNLKTYSIGSDVYSKVRN